MAVAAHRGVANPFSGCTRLSSRPSVRRKTGAQAISHSWPRVRLVRDWLGGERLKATQTRMKINRWLSVNHHLCFLCFFSQFHTFIYSFSSYPDNPIYCYKSCIALTKSLSSPPSLHLSPGGTAANVTRAQSGVPLLAPTQLRLRSLDSLWAISLPT